MGLFYEVEKGTFITQAIDKVREIASITGEIVKSEFNGISFTSEMTDNELNKIFNLKWGDENNGT